MRPILFPKDATVFNTNGMGRIDCLSCIVTEERNGMYELEAVVPEMGQHVSDIELLSILVVRHDDSDDLQPFRVYEIKQPINGKVTIYAQHISYQLANIPTMPFNVPATPTSCGRTLELLRFNATETCPFTFWTDVNTVASYQQPTPASIWQRLKGTQGSVLDQFGGEYEWDNWTVKLHKVRGALEPTVSLRYGKNITDINQEKNIINTITGVCPFWANANGDLVTLPEKVIESDYADRYPFRRTVPLDLSQEYESQPKVSQLRASAQAYINKAGIGLPSVSIKVSFVQLWQTEEYKDIAPLQRVKLCDYVNIDFERLGISEQAKVVKTRYDVLNERYESMELGNIRSTIASTITDLSGAISAEISRNNFAIRQASNELKGDIANATAWLTGSNGYVMAVKNEDGTWKELLFLDHPDAAEAIRVLRINENGIGFSSTGVEGPYTQAWTLDGKMVIGGTNVPSLTVYKQDGSVLFRISKDGIEWDTPNSIMVPSGSLIIKGGSQVNGDTITGEIDGDIVDITNIDGGNIKGTINGNTTNITNINGGNIKTGTIEADAISAGAITTPKLATNAVEASKIKAGAIETSKLAANAVTAEKISSNAITANKLAANAVEASKIKAGAIETSKLAAGAVTSAKIASNAITADKINAGAITAEKITADGITGNCIKGGTIRGANIYGATSVQVLSGGYFCKSNKDGTSIDLIATNFTCYADIFVGGNVYPEQYYYSSLGASNRRFQTVYCNSVDTNSDRRIKKYIKPLSKKYEELFFGLRPVSYKMKEGDNTTHVGAISQEIEDRLHEIGMTGNDFGGFRKHLRTKIKEPTAYDENGRPIYDLDENGRLVEVPDVDKNGNEQYDYSLNYMEFIMLNTHMLQKAYKRIEELEERLTALEKR